MTSNKKFIPALSAGLIMTSLGVLWSLQGAAVIRIRPILCLSNCKPITEGSASWLGLGVVFMLLGIAIITFTLTRRSRTKGTDTSPPGPKGTHLAGRHRGRR